MSGKILVVDDLLPNIKLLEAKLNNEYYEVFTAKSGKEALKILETIDVDVILLDVMMPDMDGFEVCRRLKSNILTQNIPVVMVTALSDKESRLEGLQAGADDFLTKPIVDMALFARIRSLIRLKRLTDELNMKNKSINNKSANAFDQWADAKVIIFDDDIGQSNKLKEIVQQLTQKVTLVQQCNEGIESLVDSEQDLVIINSQLSNIDSFRVCARLKSNALLRKIPILLLVEEGDNDTLIKAFDDKIDISDSLMTPIDFNEALVRIKTQIKKKKFQDELKDNVKESLDLAVKDSLAGCYNRNYLDQNGTNIIQNALSKKQDLSLIILDIDYFKEVNDTYGHLAGDELIKMINKIISTHLSHSDILIRFGGDEFIIILINTNIIQANIKAEIIRQAVEKTKLSFAPNTSSFKTLSIGVTSLKTEDNIKILLARADKALYNSKERGRNKVSIL